MNREVAELLKGSREATNKLTKEPASKGWGSLLSSVSSVFGSIDEDEVPVVLESQPTVQFAISDDDPSLISFNGVYEQAGVSSSTCTIDELASLLQDPKIATQPTAIKAQMVEFALSAKGVDLQTPIQDAIAKDKALDAYQSTLQNIAKDTESTNEAKIAEMTKEIQDFIAAKQTEMDQLRQDTAEKTRQSAAFNQRRSEEEQRLFNLVAPFLNGKVNPIAVGNTV